MYRASRQRLEAYLAVTPGTTVSLSKTRYAFPRIVTFRQWMLTPGWSGLP